METWNSCANDFSNLLDSLNNIFYLKNDELGSLNPFLCQQRVWSDVNIFLIFKRKFSSLSYKKAQKLEYVTSIRYLSLGFFDFFDTWDNFQKTFTKLLHVTGPKWSKNFRPIKFDYYVIIIFKQWRERQNFNLWFWPLQLF